MNNRGLTKKRQRLMEVVYECKFGYITNIYLKDGEILDDPSPQIVEDFKVGRSGPAKNTRPELSRAWLDFFRQLDKIENGHIPRIDFADGEPKRIQFSKRLKF